MRTKRWLSFVLSAAVVLTAAAPGTAHAADMDNTIEPVISVQDGADAVSARDNVQVEGDFTDLPDRDTLFEGYVEKAFWGESPVEAYGNLAAGKLEGADWKAYTVLKENITKIASGEMASTSITLSLEDLGIAKDTWSAAELGVSKIVEGNSITEEAMDAWMQQNAPDLNRVSGYLIADCPLEMYWFDKTSGISVFGPQMGASTEDGINWLLSIKSGITYQFRVAEEYRDAASENPEYTVDASLPQTVQAAAGRASEIVDKYAGYGDLEKLNAYRQEICALTSYNHEAAENPNTAYGNPWQLVWVFDGEDATSVVCEGYAKAFQYLCDLSSFQNPHTRCYTVTGEMAGGTGAGGHMWNIVTMDDGKNYIVDITNCDTGTIGADDKLFLAAADKSADNGYTVAVSGQEIHYRYDEAMEGMYGDVLQISASAYEPGHAEDSYLAYGSYGKDMVWNIDREGTFSMIGTGAMPDAETPAGIPWHAYRSEIKRVVLEEGITNVGAMTFEECRNLEEVVLPESIEVIGKAAFAFCPNLSSLTFGTQIKELHDLAFMMCTGLTELSFSPRLANVGNQVFHSCSSLKDIWFTGSCPAFYNEEVFKYTTLTLHYTNTYREGWEKLRDAGFASENITWSNYCVHVWEPDYRIDQEASCTAAGSRSIHCTLCDEVKDRVTIPPAGHHYVKEVTKATTSSLGGIVEKCSVCGNVSSTAVIYYPATVTLAKESYIYTGKELKPAVTITDSRGSVIPAENYTVAYSGNKAVGTASVHITFQGNYSGTLSKTFVINPKGTSITKLTAKAKGMSVKWKKQATQTSGYQIQYAVNKKFKGAKVIKVTKPKTKSKTVSKMKAKTKYFVRIRTYKTVKGVKYYSSWSGAKRVTTK